MGTDLWWVPPSMVRFVSRADPPSACHLSAENMLSLLQGAQCVWHKQAPEPCPHSLLARRQPCRQEGIGSYMKPQNVGVKYTESPVRYPWVASLLLLTFDSFLHFSKPQFPHLKMGLLIT